MKNILIISAILGVLIFLFGNVSVNGKEINGVFTKLFASLIGSFIASFILSLPIYGIIHLIKK